MESTSQPRIGTAVIIHRNNRVLMGLRLGALKNGLWSLVGGKLDFGETVQECCQREAKEECGLTLGASWQEVGWADDIEPDNHYVTLYLAFEHKGDAEPQAMEPEKCAEWKWLSLWEVADLDRAGLVWPNTFNAIRKVLKFHDE